MIKLWKPSRRLIMAGAASLLAAPPIVRAQTMMGVGTAASGGGAPFTPASLSNLLGWWKADAGTYQSSGTGTPSTNGTPVQNWLDQSGNNNHLTNAATTATLSTSSLNSKSTVAFIGAATNPPLQFTGTLSNCSCFGVFRHTNGSPNFDRFVSILGSSATNDYDNVNSAELSLPSTTTVELAQNYPGFSPGIDRIGSITSGTWQQMGFTFDGTNGKLFIGGTQSGTSGADANTFSAGCRIAVGGHAVTGGNALVGGCAEWFITAGTVSAGDITNIAAYLLSRWGV